MRGSCTLLLLLLCGSAAASSGGMWTPNCKQVSSGCTACSYVAPPRSSTTPRGLKQVAGAIADIASSVPVATTSSDGQLAPAVSGSTSSSSSSGGGGGELASSVSSQGAVTTQHHSGGSIGGSWSSDDLSWGGSNVWWTPGSVLTCTACDTSRGYKLVTTNGTKHCTCTARHGVVPSGGPRTRSAAVSAAWANTYVRSFTCQPCGSNAVPFLPGSNLLVAYNGAKWSIRCDSTSGSKTLLTPPLLNRIEPGSLPTQPSSSSSIAPTAAQQDAVVLESSAAQLIPGAAAATAAGADGAASAASAVEAAHARRRREQSWYKRGRRRKHGGSSGGSGGGSYIVAPWWPGQCIDCNVVGSTADPTGTYCMCGSTPPPSSPSPPPPRPPSPSPKPVPKPSPSPSPPPPPGGACVTCDTAGIESEIRDYCPSDPVVGVVYLEDFCQPQDLEIDEVTFTTSPNVIDPEIGGGTMLCAMLLEKPGATISVGTSVTGTGLTCSPTSSQYSFVVPTSGPPVFSPSPPAPRPSPSPAPSTACFRCTSETLAYYVQAMCGADPTTLIAITEFCKESGITTLDVTYTATPASILVDGDTLKCSVLVGMSGQPVTIAWTVTSATACTPKTGTFAFTVPTFASPSPSPAPPSSPAPTGACVTCVMKPVEDEIKVNCAESLDNNFYLTEYNENTDSATTPGSRCWWTDPGISLPLFKTVPDILYEDGTDTGDCNKAAQLKGMQVTVTVTVDKELDTGIVCSPVVATYTLTIPNF